MGNLNNTFKDGVFCRLFGAEEYRDNLLSLFNVLNGTNYEDSSELRINTIDDVIFMGIKNDASCILDMQMDLYEEQSTFSPNAPLRGLMYFGRLYEGYIAETGLNRYGTKLIRLLRPRYLCPLPGECQTSGSRGFAVFRSICQFRAGQLIRVDRDRAQCERGS